MGSIAFLILYFAAGIFGYVDVCPHVIVILIIVDSNVLGGNFSLVGAPSVGASGAIFGTIAVCDLYLE